MIFLSIIIPVYNAENYLCRCFETIEKQGIENQLYEIIVINDGSTDNSISVISELAIKYSNIKIVEQENQGVSVARNNGIRNASGQYLMFLDADDYVEENFLAGVLKKIKEYKFPEIIFLGYNILNRKGAVTHTLSNYEHSEKIFEGIEAYPISRGNGNLNPDRCWAILIERKFVVDHGIYFVPCIPYLEDGEFIARLLSIANRCMFYGKVFYNRTSIEGSAVNSPLFYSERAANGFLLASKNLIEFQKTKNLTHRQKVFLNQPICKFILLVLIPVCKYNKIISFYKRVKLLRNSEIRHINLEGCYSIYLFEGRLFNISPILVFINRIAFKLKLYKLIKNG